MMMCIRRFRPLVALVAIASLLFAQLAVSAYACPDLQASKPAVTQANAAAPGCNEMDMANPALCHGYCQYGNQSVDLSVPWVPPAPIVLSAVVYADAELVAEARAASPHSLLARTTAPPLAIRNCCLRF